MSVDPVRCEAGQDHSQPRLRRAGSSHKTDKFPSLLSCLFRDVGASDLGRDSGESEVRRLSYNLRLRGERDPGRCHPKRPGVGVRTSETFCEGLDPRSRVYVDSLPQRSHDVFPEASGLVSDHSESETLSDGRSRVTPRVLTGGGGRGRKREWESSVVIEESEVPERSGETPVSGVSLPYEGRTEVYP